MAAVVREGLVGTLVTAVAMAAQRRRPALPQRAQHASVQLGDPAAVRLQKPTAVLAYDVGHLEG
jgi:hypothetical protein